MVNPNTTDLITPEQPIPVQKLLDSMPGLIGALDTAIIDQVGERLPFVLLVFPPKGAIHASNLGSAEKAVDAVKQTVRAWESDAQNEMSNGEQ